jgi:hypothetical protein
MDILIKESQTKLLITEGVSEILKDIYEDTIDYSADLYKRVVKKFGINVRILLTFSAAIGGIARPLEEYLAGKYPELNEEEIIMLVVAIVSILWNENRNIVKEFVGKIQTLGIDDEFKDGLKKAKKLQSSFSRFMLTVLQGGATLSDIAAYTYMIPLVGHLVMVLQGQDFSPEQIEMLVRRLSLIGVFHVSTAVLQMIVDRILGKSN